MLARPSSLGRTNYNAPKHYWKAVLCRMRLGCQQSADIKGSHADFVRYQELCPQFNQGATRRNVQLLQELYDNFARNSVQGFEDALQKYTTQGGVLDAWDIQMLLKVKESLITPTIAAPLGKVLPAGPGEDGDDDFT